MEQEKVIQIRIKESEKGVWKEYIKSSDRFNTLSKLIKFVVGEFVRGNLIERELVVLAPETEFIQVNEKIAQLESQLGSKMEEMMDVLGKFKRNEELVGIERLKGRILKILESK